MSDIISSRLTQSLHIQIHFKCLKGEDYESKSVSVKRTTVSGFCIRPIFGNKLKSAIQMLNGVSSISFLKPKKTELELVEEDVVKGRITQWNSVDEMFDTILGK